MSIEHMIMGHIGFVSIASPTSFDLEKKIDFAEHQVTEGKPLLQYMGPALDGIGLSFMFHADYTDPQTAWDKILDLFNQHSAFPLSWTDQDDNRHVRGRDAGRDRMQSHAERICRSRTAENKAGRQKEQGESGQKGRQAQA